jgi:hypothetical protein
MRPRLASNAKIDEIDVFAVGCSIANPESLMIGFRLDVNPGVFRVRETHHRYDYAVVAQDEGSGPQLGRHHSFLGIVSSKPRVW